MTIVPKKSSAPKSNVSDIATAKGRGRGKPSGLGYDPETGREVRSSTYRDSHGSAEEDDVLRVVGPQYRPSRFYTRSLNSDNHGERMSIRVPLGLDSQVYAAVSKVPYYRSPQDFFRDAAVHRLEWLQSTGYELGDDVRRFVEMEQAEAEREKRRHEVAKMSATVKSIEASLQAQWDNEDWGMLDTEIAESRKEQEWARNPYKKQIGVLLDAWWEKGKDHILKHRAEREG